MDGTIRHDYQYDGLNRLIAAEGEVRINDHEAEYYKREFAYSPNGNLQTKKMTDRGTKTDSTNWSYTYKNHAVTSVTQNGNTVFNMSYDACGNMTSQADNHRDMIKNIAYDSKNRMISVTDKNGSIVGNYEYDEQGFRVRKTARAEGDDGDKTVEILYPSMYHGIERTKATARSTNDSDSYAVNNIYVNGVRIAAVSGDGAERHYFTDQVDSVKLVIDGDGKPIKAFEYLPYGEPWLEKGESNDNPKYNSQELDKETGYYYYNARHYDAALARFVTADTVIDGEYSVSGWNRYMYCAGNPVLYKDPSGHAVADAYLDEESQSGLRNHSINFNYDWNRNDSIKNLTMKGHQGDAGRLAKAISRQMEVPIGDRDTLGTPNRLAKSACVIASLYVDMKMAGFDVENDIGAFMTRHIDDGDVSDLNSYVYEGGKNNILSKYQIKGDYRTYGARHKIERVTDYDTFLSLLDGDGNIGKHGVVRIATQAGGGHNFNLYNNDGTIRTSDVGHQYRHGESAMPEYVNDDNFTYFEYISE